MKNYYDELEVSKTASKEIIEKVYKVLAKKYHPDTTKELDKQAAEEKFKIISEAYEILSDDEKRKKYDVELEQFNPTISYEDYINVVNQRDTLNNALNNLKKQFYQSRNSYDSNGQYYNCTTQNQFSQNQYNQTNSNINNGYNNYQHQNVNQNTNSKKKTYYYTATGKPASSFDYFKYKFSNFIFNIGFYLLIIIVLYLAIKSLFTHGLNGLLS